MDSAIESALEPEELCAGGSLAQDGGETLF